MANTNARRLASNKALGAIAGAMVAADPSRGRGLEQARPLLAGENDRQGIARTVDKLAGAAPQAPERLTPIPDAVGSLEQATGFLDQVLETLEHRLEPILMSPAVNGGATAMSVPAEFCELSGRIEHQARRVRSSNERLLALLDRLGL